MKIKAFQEPILDDLERFRKSYRDILKSGVAIIDHIVDYLARTQGNALRPTMTLLCARIGSDTCSENAIKAAVIVELLHEATLVHDDVVDESAMRRGFPSLTSRYKNKIAVLFGDYMLSNVLTQTLESRDMRWLDILADTSRRLAKGELVQAARAKRVNMTEHDYLDMIKDKTAALFSACCKLGGISGGLADEHIETLGKFGDCFGIIFQIRDDLLDLFGEISIIGKPIGGDLREKKLTLPVLGALAQVDVKTGRRIRARIRRGIKSKEIKDIIIFVKEHDGDVYAEKTLAEKTQEAYHLLDTLPDAPVIENLKQLVNFAATRKR